MSHDDKNEELIFPDGTRFSFSGGRGIFGGPAVTRSTATPEQLKEWELALAALMKRDYESELGDKRDRWLATLAYSMTNGGADLDQNQAKELHDLLSERSANEYICKCGVRVTPHRCSTEKDF